MGLRGLAEKVVVVVGGGTGIGAATAARLGAEGCRVVVGDVADDAALQTATRIVAAGGTADHVHFDLSDPESVAGLIHDAATIYGGVDLLFNVGADMRTLSAAPTWSTSTSMCGTGSWQSACVAMWRR